MAQRHINPVSNGNSQDNQYIPPVVGAALGTILTGIGVTQFKKGGVDYVSIGNCLGGIGIKGICDCLTAKAYYHQDLQEQDADRRGLNGSRSKRITEENGKIYWEWQRAKKEMQWECKTIVTPVQSIETNSEWQLPEYDTLREGEGESTYRIKARE